MNAKPNERRDADALDAFWDEIVLGPLSGRPLRLAESPDEELVMELQTLTPGYDAGAEQRLRQLVFGSAPEPLPAAGPVRPLPLPTPAPAGNNWSVRNLTSLAAAALIVVLVGALVAAQNAGWFGSGSENDSPTAIPAAISQLDATPAALGSPTVQSPILWTLPFDGTNVEVGASALSNGTLYRLIRSDEFIGVQAIDTATGTERWRSEQAWSGVGLGADQTGVYFLTLGGVRALDVATGDQIWDITTMVAPNALALSGARLYLWDGRQSMLAIETSNGDVAWEGVADVDTTTTSARTSLPPVVAASGIAAVSGTGTVAFFDMDGHFTGSAGNFKPESVALAAAPDDAVAIAGVTLQETEEPWARKLMLVNLADGSTRWVTDYNALVTGLTVTDSMAFVLADNSGLAVRDVQLVDGQGTVTTEETNPYPEQTSPQIYGYDLDTGEMHFTPDPDREGTSHGWVTDSGSPPFATLAQGPEGPIAISQSGRLTFFGTQNPLVQAVVDLPGALPNKVSANDAAVYVSLEDGAVTAIAPMLAGLEPQDVSRTANIDWTMPLDGTLIECGGMTYGEGLVFRLIDAGAGKQIEATYASTGQSAWALPFDWSTAQIVADPGPDPYDPAQTWASSGNIFVVDAQNRLIALDGSSATVDWQAAFQQPVVSMLFDNGTLYVWDESGTMTALNASDGAVVWGTSSGADGGPQSNELGMPVPVATSAIVAMVDAQGTLHGFDRASGELLWSTPGFDGTNTRLVHQGLADAGQQEWFVALSANGPQQDDGAFVMTLSGLLAQTGERRWDDYITGPLVQPVATNETMVFVVGNGAETGKAVPESTPLVDAESHNHYVWTGSGEPAPVAGGQRLFSIDVDTGQIVWIRTTAAGGFTGLSTSYPNSGALRAVTTDGQLISPSRGNGSIDGAPTDLGGPVLLITSSGETGAIGSFATLSDGTLVAFGGLPFSQQG